MTHRSWIALGVSAALSLAACEGGGDTITPEDLAGVFARRSACSDLTLTSGLASIVGHSDGSAAASSSELACGRSAGSCEDFLRCAGIGEVACDPTDFAARCEGTELVTCHSSGFERRVDCAADDDGNTQCQTNSLGMTSCGTGPCEGGEAISCDGDVLVSCVGGVARRAEDCGLAGRTCVVFGGMVGGCVDRVESCNDDACDGDFRLQCVAGMGYVETDCGATLVPSDCRVRSGDAECFLMESQCEEGAAECAGAVARFCAGGRWIDIDCAAADGASCVDESSDGVARLRCAL